MGFLRGRWSESPIDWFRMHYPHHDCQTRWEVVLQIDWSMVLVTQRDGEILSV